MICNLNVLIGTKQLRVKAVLYDSTCCIQFSFWCMGSQKVQNYVRQTLTLPQTAPDIGWTLKNTSKCKLHRCNLYDAKEP